MCTGLNYLTDPRRTFDLEGGNLGEIEWRADNCNNNQLFTGL